MKIQIDVKSAVLGLLVGVVGFFVMGAASNNPVGKYQVQISTDRSPGARGFGIIIDTQTGETWGLDFGVNWDAKQNMFWNPK